MFAVGSLTDGCGVSESLVHAGNMGRSKMLFVKMVLHLARRCVFSPLLVFFFSIMMTIGINSNHRNYEK